MHCYDAHNHLQDDRFAGRQAELVEACRSAGVRAMVVNGSCEADWEAVAALARRHPGFVIPAFGLHPWYLPERTGAWRRELDRRLDTTPGAVVGEIGIDRWILESPPGVRARVAPDLAPLQAAPLAEQEEVFREQLTLAAARNVAASIHCLQAWGRMHALLRAGPVPARGFLLHSYGGPAEMVVPLARLGARFSFPGYFLHPRKARQLDVFRVVPPHRLLVETDAPDQRPPERVELLDPAGAFVSSEPSRPFAGADGRTWNHPANLPWIQRALAASLGRAETELSHRAEVAFRELFSTPSDA